MLKVGRRNFWVDAGVCLDEVLVPLGWANVDVLVENEMIPRNTVFVSKSVARGKDGLLLGESSDVPN